MMEKNITILSLLLVSPFLQGQGLFDSIPTLDYLLELRWQIKGHEFSSNPLVHEDLIFETFGLEYALDAVSGEKLYYRKSKHQLKIRQGCKDSLVFFTSRNSSVLLNIYSGDVL